MAEKSCTHPGCFVCGPEETNPQGLHLSITWDAGEERSRAEFTPSPFWNGFEGVTHGGIISCILDDLMAWAVRHTTGKWAATGSMKTTYRRPVHIGTPYKATGRVTRKGSRKIHTQAHIEDIQGNLCVECEAIFFFLPSSGE